MNDETLANKLIHMTQEVRDLKTAHQRGLGTTRFYKYTLQIYVGTADWYNFIARVATDEPERPAVNVLINIDEPILGASLSYLRIDSTDINFTVFSGWQTADHTRLTVTLISSSKIGEFRQA